MFPMQVDIISLEFVLVIYITNLLGAMELDWARGDTKVASGVRKRVATPRHTMTLKN